MRVIEEASNMLLIESEDGLIQKANNARTRLKYGAGELEPMPELFTSNFSDGAFEFGDGDVYVYPTANDSVFITMFHEGTDSLPIAAQNPAGGTLSFLSSIEEYLSDNDLDKFKDSFKNRVTVKDNHNASEDGAVVRRPLMGSWFSEVPDFNVEDDGIYITEDILLNWNGEATKTGLYPTQIITEFNPMVDFMYRPEVKPRWNQSYELTQTELYLIQRATRIYDKLVSLDEGNDFDTMNVQLF
jgi:hypothetical protein